MTTQEKREPRKVTITDLAIAHGLTYQAALNKALQGRFGPIERIGSRLFVRAGRVED